MRPWIEPPDVEAPEVLRAAVRGHPLVAETLARRGFDDVPSALAFLDPDLYRPAPASDLPNLAEAVARIEHAIRHGERICVWGDFDVDGQTATTVLFTTLRDLGGAVTYHIPNRQTESHGVNMPALSRVIDDGASLVVTCDTGVTAHEAIAFAQARDVDVIVTDHHDLPPDLPAAFAIVNPKMLPATHPLYTLPGVGCAYKLAEALYEQAGRSDDAAQQLDLLALGIVADVAVQTDDARYLLQRGLEALRQTERLGLRTLMELADLRREWLTEEHIAFALAPRLNALGRLADANVAVEFFTTDDLTRARIIASELEALNARRKLMADQVLRAAQAQIQQDRSLLDGAALVLSHPAWPAGIIGPVASRLAEQYGKPTVLFAAPPGGLARGSARSVQGCNITEAIAANRGMLVTFGGHPMAAGLAISPERIPEFRRALSRTVLQMVGKELTRPGIEISAYLSLSEITLDLVEQLERLAPFGPGNPALTLATRGLVVKSQTPVGRDGEHLQVIVEDEEGTSRPVIWWQAADWEVPQGRFDLAYTVRASDFRGERDAQMTWADARVVEEAAVSVRAVPTVRVVDYRSAPAPEAILKSLAAQPDTQIWSEAQARAQTAGRDRRELEASRVLAIWTTPAGPAELRAALQRAKPETVYLFAVDPRLDASEPFLKRLAGLIKHALDADDGRVRISTLAAATAQREATIWAGIAWLLARGHLAVMQEQGDEVQFTTGNGIASPDIPRVTAELKALLEETAAYRAHFATADKDSLLQEM